MKASAIPLQPGMWLLDPSDGEVLTLLCWEDPVWESHGDLHDGAIMLRVDIDASGEPVEDGEVFEILDHPANVGPLFEACVDRWRDFFVDRTRSNVAPWRAFPRRGDAPIACEATLCGVLIAALELPEKGPQ